jgi:hypothetical protein
MHFSSRLISAALLVLAVIAVSGCGGDPDKNKLIFRPEIGDARKILITENIAINANIAIMQLTPSIEVELRFDAAVTDVTPEGQITVEATYDKAKMNVGLGELGNIMAMANPQGSADYDQSMNDMNTMLEQLAGKSFSVFYDRHGKALNVSGADEIARELASSASQELEGQGLTPAQLQQTESQMVNALGNDMMRFLLSRVAVPAPDLPLTSPEDVFNLSGSVSGAVTANADMTYTFSERTETLVTLTETGTVSLSMDLAKALAQVDAAALPKEVQGMGFTLGTNGTSTGQVTVEQPAGWTEDWTTAGSLKGNIDIMLGQGLPKTQTPIEINVRRSLQTFPQ